MPGEPWSVPSGCWQCCGRSDSVLDLYPCLDDKPSGMHSELSRSFLPFMPMCFHAGLLP